MTDFNKECPKSERCANVNSMYCYKCSCARWYPYFERRVKTHSGRPKRKVSRARAYKQAQAKAEKKLAEIRLKETRNY